MAFLATVSISRTWAESIADRKQAVETAFDHYTAAKTEDQRVAIVDYLQHFDRKIVASALIDHIIASRTGTEATAYNQLVGALGPDGATAVMDRLTIADKPVVKGKLIVALRHCLGDDIIHALAGCLDDKRPVPFEAHGHNPRRVCDLAYDELFLKLHTVPYYGLDPSQHLKGIITEKTPVKTRDALIAGLKVNLAAAPSVAPAPGASPSPSPSPTPAVKVQYLHLPPASSQHPVIFSSAPPAAASPRTPAAPASPGQLKA